MQANYNYKPPEKTNQEQTSTSNPRGLVTLKNHYEKVRSVIQQVEHDFLTLTEDGTETNVSHLKYAGTKFVDGVEQPLWFGRTKNSNG